MISQDFYECKMKDEVLHRKCYVLLIFLLPAKISLDGILYFLKAKTDLESNPRVFLRALEDAVLLC